MSELAGVIDTLDAVESSRLDIMVGLGPETVPELVDTKSPVEVGVVSVPEFNVALIDSALVLLRVVPAVEPEGKLESE